MNPAPNAIISPVLGILDEAIIRIRSYGWASDPLRCAVEADHVHNLASLLMNYSPERLRYYLDVERKAYMKQSVGHDLAAFQPHWVQLDAQVEA
jgi:hypothetical protein